jgi:hypothetical protein
LNCWAQFFKDTLLTVNVSTMPMILHDCNLEKKMHLIRAGSERAQARWPTFEL